MVRHRLLALICAACACWTCLGLQQSALAGDRARGIEVVGAPVEGGHPAPRHFWAVIIGVSTYANAAKGVANLDYAAEDARALTAALTDPSFGPGGIPPGQILTLVDQAATVQAIRAALFDFMAKPGRDDFVLVFYAGHGAPDPARPEDLYLLPHDADPERLGSTAVSMEDVKRAFDRVRGSVLLLADACHSAAILVPGGKLRAMRTPNPSHAALAGVAKGRRRRTILTSSEANETSMEARRWSHGVFTWALLAALRGEADREGNRDGTVTLGETIDYVRNQVERETAFRQHPVASGDLDGRLALAQVRPSQLEQRAAPARPQPPVALPGTAKPSKPTKPAPGSAKATAAAALLNLGEVMLEARIQKPSVFYVLSRTAMPTDLPPQDRARAVPMVLTVWQQWQAARTRVRTIQQTRGQLRERLDACERAVPQHTGATQRTSYCGQERQAVAAGDAERDKAELALNQSEDQLVVVLDAAIAADASPLSGVPGAFWLAQVEALTQQEFRRYYQAMDVYTAQQDTPGTTAQPQEPRLNMERATALLDAFLDRFAHHPWRAWALYDRAWLESEWHGEDNRVFTGTLLAVIAEFPDHPLAGEISLRLGQAYADSGDPRAQPLAREHFLAAIERAKDAQFRSIAQYQAAWLAFRSERFDEAILLFATLIAQGSGGSAQVDLRAEAVEALATIAEELRRIDFVLSAALPAEAKADVLAAAAQRILEVGEPALAEGWLTEALRQDPLAMAAPRWDRLLIQALLQLGRREEAADRMGSRFERFGPRSSWFKAHGPQAPSGLLQDLSDDVVKAAELRAQQPDARPAGGPPAGGSGAASGDDAQRKALLGPVRQILSHCQTSALRQNPGMRCRFTLEFTLDGDGAASAVQLQAASVPKGVAECVEARLLRLRVPTVPHRRARLKVVLAGSGG